MSELLTPVLAGESVSKADRRQETPRDVSQWFETETLEVNFGETVGRPSADAALKYEYIVSFLQSGWTIDAVVDSGEGGNWVQVGGSTTVSKSQQFYPDFQDSMFAAGFNGLESDLYSKTHGFAFIQRGYRNSTPLTVSQSESTPSNDAPAYWAAWQKIRLKRRRLVAERVMQSMVDSFASAYNEGRAIEDARYNEVVSLYSLMLSRSEAEGNEIVSGETDLMPLANRMAEAVLASVDKADEDADEAAELVVENRERDVNRQFDLLVAQTKAQMVTNGTYNGTIWPSVHAGIERQRSEALGKAREAGTTARLNVRQSVATLRSNVLGSLLQSMQSVASAADQRKVTVVEMRNSVLKWMLDYIGSREESYPELEEVATVAERMGFSVGSAGSVL